MGACSAAAYNQETGGGALKSIVMPYGQAERLLPLIGDVLQEAGITYQDLRTLVVTAGPGSFAGLRVGLATAKALALALQIPLYGLSTFQALAFEYAMKEKPATEFAVAVDTRRDDFYIQIFDRNANPAGEMLCLTGAEIAELLKGRDLVLIGDAAFRLAAAYPDFQSSDQYSYPNSLIVASVFTYASNLFIFDPKPLYLRGADVSKPKALFRQLETDI